MTHPEIHEVSEVHKHLIRDAVGEMRLAAEADTELPADTKLVWVLSAPGTYLSQATPELGQIYSHDTHDRNNLQTGVAAALDITANRLGVDVTELTAEDIAANGPLLYYNGEGDNTNFRQNSDLRAAIESGEFPYPAELVRIGEIEQANTPAQAKDMAEFLGDHPEIDHVAVVSLLSHAPRVSRYIEKAVEDGVMPEGVEFYGVPVPVGDESLGAGVREVRKIVEYYDKGHLSADSAVPEYHYPRLDTLLTVEEWAFEGAGQPELTDQSKATIDALLREPFGGEAPDAVVALSGGIKPKNSENPEDFTTLLYSDKNETGVVVPSKTRVVATAAIAEVLPDVPIVTNSVDRTQPEWPSMASVVTQELVERGVDEDRIIPEETSFNTVTQLIETIKLAVENDWTKVTLVANDWYFPRLGRFIEQLPHIVTYEDPAQNEAFHAALASFAEMGGQISMVASEEVLLAAHPRYRSILRASKHAMEQTVASEARGSQALDEGRYAVSLKV